MDAAIRQGERAIAKIDENVAIVARLRELKAKKASGATFSPQDTAYLKQYEALDADLVPNGDALHDAELPRQQLARDAGTGADRGAEKACKEFEKDVAKEKGRLASEAERAKDARARIAAAPEPAEPPVPTTGRERLAGRSAPSDWADFGGYRIPDGPEPGSKWARAEQAMRDGDYAGARELYRQAHAEGTITDALFEGLEQRVDEAALSRRRPLGEKQDTSAEIPPDVAEDILKRRWDSKDPKDLRVPIERSDPQAIGQVWRYSDETGSYILKEVPLTQPGNVDMIESAIVSSRLMDELGIPSARVAFRQVKVGDQEMVRFIIRRIDGEDLTKLSSGELFHYRQELSEQRAFSLLIRDYDRKTANAFLGKDGRVYYIDADLASMYEGQPIRPGKLEGRWGQDHWYLRSNETVRQLAGDTDPEMVKRFTNGLKTNMVERSLTANDAQGMVKRIQTLMDPANQPRLEAILTRAYREARGPAAQEGVIKTLVSRTIETMRARTTKIPEVLKLLNERNGTPLAGL